MDVRGKTMELWREVCKANDDLPSQSLRDLAWALTGEALSRAMFHLVISIKNAELGVRPDSIGDLVLSCKEQETKPGSFEGAK